MLRNFGVFFQVAGIYDHHQYYMYTVVNDNVVLLALNGGVMGRVATVALLQCTKKLCSRVRNHRNRTDCKLKVLF